VISAMLQEVKQVRAHYEAQQRHEWQPIISGELTGKTVGIVGLGGIGRAVARRAKAFEMRVIGTKRSPLVDPNVDEILPPDRLGELLAASDFVVLTAPLTDETRGLIGAAELAQMRPEAVLINVARGEIVDEAALGEALRAGASEESDRGIAAAYLDVVGTEPLPATSPLWELPNCTLTPHDSDTSLLGHGRTTERFLENLVRYVRGEPLLDVAETTGLTPAPR
jgi:phosphoglycerate dehydrogenase-like enzyme